MESDTFTRQTYAAFRFVVQQNEGEYIDVSEISKQCNVDINEDSGNLSYHSASCGSEIYEKVGCCMYDFVTVLAV